MHQEVDQEHHPGFRFDNYQRYWIDLQFVARNLAFSAHPKATSTGTTIVGMIYKVIEMSH